MASSTEKRGVIYVESGENNSRASSVERNSLGATSPPIGGSNYVIKIQIGEESMFNPVRIDVSTNKGGNKLPSLGHNGHNLGLGPTGGCKESPKSPLVICESPGEEESSCSGQSSPRSDMTSPSRINAGGANRFGSETSESDTESDISSAEFRPISCQAAQFALREICQVESSPPLRGIMKKVSNGSLIISKPPPLPSSMETQPGHPGHPGMTTKTTVGLISIGHPVGSLDKSGGIIGKIQSLSEAMAEKRQMEKPDRGKTILFDQREFHVNEINGIGIKAGVESEESLSNFAGYKDIFSRTARDGTKQILSDKGTIRGVKNRVRDGIATFLQSKDTKTYKEKEQGRVVVYVTSMGVVRSTFLRCQKVKSILRNLLVKFDERDCYMNRSIQNEFRHRMPQQYLALPQVFLEGQLLGDAEVIEKLNETGELRDLLKPYKSLSVLSTCERCGGFRMLPCQICNGSKKSVHRNHFTTEFIALKCMHCDPSGLVQCDICNAPDS